MTDFLNTVKGMATGGTDLNLGNFLGSNFVAKAAWIGKIVFYITVFLFVCLLIYKFVLQYKTKITVFKMVGGRIVETVKDKAKTVTDTQNKKKFQLFKTRWGKKPVTCPIPESVFKTKQGKKDHYYLWLDDNGQLHPVEFDLSSGIDARLRIRPQERDAWARMEDKILIDKFYKQSFMEKFLPSIVMITAFVMAFLIFFFMSKDLGNSLSGLASTFQQVASSCTTLTGG